MNTKKPLTLNRDLASDKISMPYPHVLMLEPSDAAALVVTSLDKGDLPVVCEYEGQVRKIADIRKSALTLHALRQVTRIVYVTSPDVRSELDTTYDIMEVL